MLGKLQTYQLQPTKFYEKSLRSGLFIGVRQEAMGLGFGSFNYHRTQLNMCSAQLLTLVERLKQQTGIADTTDPADTVDVSLLTQLHSRHGLRLISPIKADQSTAADAREARTPATPDPGVVFHSTQVGRHAVYVPAR